VSHNHAPNNSWLTTTANLPSSTNFTMMAWFRTSVSGQLRGLYGSQTVQLRVTTGNALIIRVGGTDVTVLTDITTGVWYWTAIVSSSATNRVGYVSDGLGAITQATNTASNSTATSYLVVGARTDTGSSPCESEIAAVKIWDAALTLDELSAERDSFEPKRRANLNRWTPCWNASDARDYGPLQSDWTVNGTIVTGINPPIRYRRRPARWAKVTTGGPALLAANAVAAGTLTGEPTTAIRCASASAAPATLIGLPTTAIQCASTAAAPAALTGDASTAIRLLTAAAAVATLGGDATTLVRLITSGSGSATLTGTLAGGEGALLSASASAPATLTGDVTTAIRLMTAAAGPATLAADPTTLVRLAAPVQAPAALTGDPITTVILRASASRDASVTGTITTAILLQVVREALATLSGFLTAGGAPPTAPQMVRSTMIFNVFVPITPSNTQDLAEITDSVYVGTGGDVAAVAEDGTVTIMTAPSGAILPIQIRRVNATGTTATGLIALYHR
jgi:hypothetical protein